MRDPRVAVVAMHTSPLSRPGGNKAGGLNVYVMELSRELVKLGCSVDIFTRKAAPGILDVVVVEPGLRVIYVAAGPAEALGPEALHPYVDEFADGIDAFARGEGGEYDVIHSHYWLAGLAGNLLKERWRIPHLTMFHTLGEVKNRASFSESEPALRIDAEARVVAGADRVICATEHEKSLLVQLYGADPARIEIIPLGVDIDRFRPLDKDEARRQLGFEDAKIILLWAVSSL